jgi:U3 small nucleolar RNA-associated protein 13
LSPSEKELVIVTSSLSIRIYTLPALYSSPLTKPLEPVRHIPKAHEAPVHVVIIDPSSSYIATGSADGVAKVWDLRKGYITHVFKGHGGVISCLQFYLSTSQGKEGGSPQLTLATGSVDTRVRLFNLSDANQRSTSAKANTILDGHVSVPRGMAFSSDGKWLLTAGRDSVVLVWDLSSQGKPSSKAKGDEKPKKITPWLWKTIPVSDTVEALGIIDQTVELHGVTKDADSLHFFIAGEKGQVQIWDAHKGKALARLGESREKQSSDAQELQSILECM